MVISFRSLRHRQVRPMTICVKIVRRTIILFGLGLFVSNCKSMLLTALVKNIKKWHSILTDLRRVNIVFQSPCAGLVILDVQCI